MTTRSRTRVTSKILHDLRNPLNQIIGYTEMLSEDAGAQPAETMASDLAKIRDAGKRMLSVIEENFDSTNEAPLTRAHERPHGPPRLQSPSQAVAAGLLLVVDDDSRNREVLSRRLQRQGHVVRTANNGREALAVLREDSFDLVLLDIMMPEMDGYAVLGHIKTDEALQHIPVIMISALNEMQSVVRCVEAGAEDYLTKPFDSTLLRARIEACLEKKRGRDRENALFFQLRENFEKLQELEKRRDDMRNMIVHDLRTPLTGVIVGLQMLETHDALSETQRVLVNIAASGGKTLLDMINDLLDVEKMESGTTQLHYEPLSASTLVAAALQQVATLAEEARTAVITDIGPTVPEFAGDANKLRRTLVNLIANAIKFTRAGTIHITAAASGDDAIRFAVRDTGPGIPAEAFTRIFEKFGQLEGRTARIGTGLGLAFCKLAVEAHGGQIRVESTPGEGSTFSFDIPLQAA